jgi:hypothetical protein
VQIPGGGEAGLMKMSNAMPSWPLESLANTVHRPGFADEAMSTEKTIAVAN